MPGVPFHWSQYFTLANELGGRADEASLRSAISRAYYYVYHLALARAKSNAFEAKSGEGVHHQLWRVFSASPESDCRKLAFIGPRLKEKRTRADYQSSYARVAEDIPELLKDADEFAKLLEKLPSRHPNPGSMRQ
jgi:uncharacterized protein (UPF0332 family)